MRARTAQIVSTVTYSHSIHFFFSDNLVDAININIKNMVSNQCETGTLLNLFFFFFTQDINDCNPDPCQNGGTCTDGMNDYSCKCTPGFEGKNCTESKYRQILTLDSFFSKVTLLMLLNVDIKNMVSNQCKTGTLLNLFFFSFTKDINDCNPDPCQNGGNCTDGMNDYSCKCAPGFEGTNCTESKYTLTHFGLTLFSVDRIHVLRLAIYNMFSKYFRTGKSLNFFFLFSLLKRYQ